MIMQLFFEFEATLLFCIVKLLFLDTILIESNEVVVLLVTFNEAVNSSSTIELNCVAHGRTSAPSIEWASVINRRTTVIRNSTSNRHTICAQSKYTLTESTLKIEDARLEDAGVYVCTARLNVEDSVIEANKLTMLTVIARKAVGNASTLTGALAAGAACVPALALLLVGALITWCYYRRRQRKKSDSQSTMDIINNFILSNKVSEEMEALDAINNIKKHWGAIAIDQETTEESEANIKELLIQRTDIQVMNIIGEGEFSHVYEGKLQKEVVVERAHISVTKSGPVSVMKREIVKQTIKVAIKSLKGSFTKDDTEDLIRESVLMYKFDHPNVISLIGLCLDAAPSPYIILPFMENGSLLSYIKNSRATLYTNSDTEDEIVCIVQKQLMDMCIQIAKGMEYLANMKITHRDLAARNCMINENWVIKVADFGLSEVITASKDYFRQRSDVSVKLPIKWMAPESLYDGIFSEKTDVWSYGVTCWEIFSIGRFPYQGVHPMTLARELSNGLRLYKPDNTACSDQMYAMMMRCWEEDPELRPGFSELVQSIGKDLQGMTDYIYTSTFKNQY